MSSLEVSAASKRFGAVQALDQVSFRVPDRQFLVVFGHAGAGKTTLLNLIAGIVSADAGEIRLDERRVDGEEPGERNVAMVFESYALYPHLSVFDNMAFPLRSPRYRQPEAQVAARVRQVAATLKIDHLLGRTIQALSNGQRQRTALGRALVRQPRLFLMDEPLSHLDAKLRNHMRLELKQVQAELNTTTVYVTHDFLEALSLGDRILVLDHGRVQQLGTPEEVYRTPANARVARAFGDPQINLFGLEPAGVVNGSDPGWTAPALPGFRLQPPPALAATLRAAGGPLWVGVRPADVHLEGAPAGGSRDGAVAADPAAPRARGTVFSFSPLGAQALVLVQTEKGEIVRAFADADHVLAADAPVSFRCDPAALIFFAGPTLDDALFCARSGPGGDNPGDPPAGGGDPARQSAP